MCLCEGKGSVPLQDGSIIQWHPCPDSNCKHDPTDIRIRISEGLLNTIEWKERVEAEQRDLIGS